ncbi:Hypothetical protein Minf_1001 [Methylacidiphilum infernorum V4]|uniref:Uncharacterized protein n=1 Tax=Methylacidiphilum infernorum (isolate V4) TaxID=481448 RepID=B3DUQ3_METI4|nr:Hypothetical protein Minf_1001 [Methylacidiphilum infernorum V4]
MVLNGLKKQQKGDFSFGPLFQAAGFKPFEPPLSRVENRGKKEKHCCSFYLSEQGGKTITQ